MKLNELLDKAIIIVDDRIKVHSLNFERRLSIDDSRHPISDNLVVFYSYNKKKSNFTVTAYDYNENYGYETLLDELEFKVREILKKSKDLANLEL